jgi:hypothetical protein
MPDCLRCHGTTRIGCPRCEGAGEVDCETCYGAGEIDCPACQGTREVNWVSRIAWLTLVFILWYVFFRVLFVQQ